MDGAKAYETHTEVYPDKETLGVDHRPTYDSARTTKLLRKMDINIVPFLALLYLLVLSSFYKSFLIKITVYLSSIVPISEMRVSLA